MARSQTALKQGRTEEESLETEQVTIRLTVPKQLWRKYKRIFGQKAFERVWSARVESGLKEFEKAPEVLGLELDWAVDD